MSATVVVSALSLLGNGKSNVECKCDGERVCYSKIHSATYRPGVKGSLVLVVMHCFDTN